MSELELVQHRQIDGISVFFDTVEYRTPHFHPEWELLWVTDGSLLVRCGRQETRHETGDLLLFSPNRVHEFCRTGQNATFLCVQVSPQAFETVYPELRTLAVDDYVASAKLENAQRLALCEQLKELMRAYLDRKPYYALACAGICAQIFSSLLAVLPVRRMSEGELSNVVKRNARLTRFVDYVDAHYTQPMSLSDFAVQEGCSVSYLSRFLKENLNQTFQEYVNTVRFHSACRLIRSGGLRMLDVCEESGFSDYRYFSRCFRKRCGMTPEEYRRSGMSSVSVPERQSLHSVERFYTSEESDAMLRSLR